MHIFYSYGIKKAQTTTASGKSRMKAHHRLISYNDMIQRPQPGSPKFKAHSAMLAMKKKKKTTQSSSITRYFVLLLLCTRSKSPVLVEELGVELDDALDPVGTGGEEGCAEVECALLLTESRARDGADTGGVEHLQAVELIGSAALGLSGFNGLGGEVDGGEEVHSPLVITR